MARWKVRFPVLTVPLQLWSTLRILSAHLDSFSSHIKNHRILEIGRHLWTSVSPTLCSKQSRLELTAQGCVQSGFKYFQGWRIHNLSRPPMAVGNFRHKDALLLNFLSTRILRPTLQSCFPAGLRGLFSLQEQDLAFSFAKLPAFPDSPSL